MSKSNKTESAKPSPTVASGPAPTLEAAKSRLEALKAEILAARQAVKELKGPTWTAPTAKPGARVGFIADKLQPETKAILDRFVDAFAGTDADPVPTLDEIVQAGMSRVMAIRGARERRAQTAATPAPAVAS